MIKIDVAGKFQIDRDTLNWILKKEVPHPKEEGKMKLVTIGYYGSLKQLAKGIVERVDIVDKDTLDDLIDAYDDLSEILEQSIESRINGN